MNLKAGNVEVFRNPAGKEYSEQSEGVRSEQIAPLMASGPAVSVADVLTQV